MLHRFVSAAAVGSIAVAAGALMLLLIPAVRLKVVYPLVVAWCFVPLIWGVWAMLAPASWVPKRLPIWGVFLGFIGQFIAMFVLDMPSRVLGTPAPWTWRVAGGVAVMVIYYFLWALVSVMYQNLTTPAPRVTSKAA